MLQRPPAALVHGLLNSSKWPLRTCLQDIKGSIKFDGKNIGDIPLSELRSSISIIPQEPIIFSETVRKNLDPTEKYSDEKLWSVLEKVQLKSFIAEKIEKLDYMLSEQGANLR